MKYIELQQYEEYSVVLRQNDNGTPLAVSPFVVAYKPDIEDGKVISWERGNYFDDLFKATDFARTKGCRPSYYRLEEIAGKAIDGLIQDDEDSAYEYFANEIEMDSHEAEYFGLNPELLESYK